MRNFLLLTIVSIIAAYLFSGDYNQSIIKYEINRTLSSQIENKDIIPGKHFQELGSKISDVDSDISIVFTYNSKASMLLNYELSKNKDVYDQIELIHAVHNKEWQEDARLFFSLKQFSLDKKSLGTLLKFYHEDKKLNKLKLNNFLTDSKIAHVPFWSSYSSLNTKAVFEPVSRIENETKTEGFPLVIIKGKYLIKPWLYESYKDIPVVIEFLLEK